MASITGLIKMGDTYLVVVGSAIASKIHVPKHCFQDCNQIGCKCSDVELVRQMEMQGRIADLAQCRGSIVMCMQRLHG